MSDSPKPTTVGALRETGYARRTVRDEIRLNLLSKLRTRQPVFEGIHGFDDSVMPAMYNALLSGHDILLLGERGQGKTRLIRQLVGLLDEWMPELDGSEVRDDPLAPISAWGKRHLSEAGDDAQVRWVNRSERYGEKLATPDVATADLIGDIDPMKVVEGRSLSDEETIHFGLLPRTNRGIFCINELPDLTEKIQVALFNVMQERDFQIKGHRVRLPLDVMVVASANPEDYTSRGRIVTPLKDRYAAQIRTHYPPTRELELSVVEQEAKVFSVEGVTVFMPEFMKRIVAEVTLQARASPDINQASGVSVRLSIANYETLVANALRRALSHGNGEAVPRVSDLGALHGSISGKIELEYAAADRGEEEIVDGLVKRATAVVFDELFDELVGDPEAGNAVVDAFDQGWMVEVSDDTPASEFMEGLAKIPGLSDLVGKFDPTDAPARVAATIEFLLEGLHLRGRLNKQTEQRGSVYGKRAAG